MLKTNNVFYIPVRGKDGKTNKMQLHLCLFDEAVYKIKTDG